MSLVIEVKYFNTFVAKKVAMRGEKVYTVKPKPDWLDADPIPGIYEAGPNGGWFGFPWNPTGYPEFPTTIFNNPSLAPSDTWYMNGIGWLIEESRIQGGYNNDIVGQGVRAYLVDNEASSQRRKSSLIYSGTLNNRTDINKTNVFNVGEDITRTIQPEYGSIQKIHSDDGNLLILQENKTSQALIDKDVIYSAEGGQVTTAGKVVIGPVTPYAGDYGVSLSPESFDNHGFRKYYADKNRNAIIRLSRDGITEISEYGMYDYFRDKLSELDQSFRTIDLEWVSQPMYFQANGSQANIGDIATSCDIFIDTRGFYTTISNGMTIVNPATGNATDFYISEISQTTSDKITINFSDGIDLTSDFIDGLTFRTVVKDEIKGAWDSHNKCYTLSMQRYYKSKTFYVDPEEIECSGEALKKEYQTLNFDEKSKGWVSFFTYCPDQMFSVKNRFYSTKTIIENRDVLNPQGQPIGTAFGTSAIYVHYSDISNRGEFYKVTSDSNITSILNANPHVVKNFKTINYEGSNGWEMTMMYSSATGVDNTRLSFDPAAPSSIINTDTANPVKSFYEGAFTVQEQVGAPPLITEFPDALPANTKIFRGGFDRKENKYYSNLKNSSTVKPGEVVFGSAASGIKGFYSIVTFKTDSTTDAGGMKEMFSIGSEFVVSSY